MRRRTILKTSTNDSKPWRLATRPARTTLLIVGTGLVVLVLFRLMPELDQWTATLFYTAEDCVLDQCLPFAAVEHSFWQDVREFGLTIPRLAILATFIWLAWALFWPARRTAQDVVIPMFAAISAFIGPLLIVNWILKELWGRPRPFQTAPFGGDGVYVPPGTISDQCASNCSFVSGEAAAAFWLVWLVFIVPRHWQTAVLAGVIGFATGISILRMAFGRHYLSDVTMSAFIATACVTGTIWALQSAAGRRLIDRIVAWSNARSNARAQR